MVLCLQCKSNSYIKNNPSKGGKLAKWIKKQGRVTALPPKRPKPTHRSYYPTKSTVSVELKVGGKNRKVLFWVSDADKIGDSIKTAPNAYKDYKNMGIAWIKNGILKLKCRSPCPYFEEGKIWPPHIHYSEAKNKDEWKRSVFTIAGYPGNHGKYTMKCINVSSQCRILTPQLVKKNWNKFTVLNSVPDSECIQKKYGKKGINLPYNSSVQRIKDVCKKIKNKPFLVYGRNTKCNYSSKLIERMIENGCMNVYYMPKGEIGWKTSL